MKKFLSLCVAALGLFGCAKVEEAAVFSVPDTDPSGIVLQEALPAPPGQPVTVYAGLSDGPETRSRIALDGAAAKVLWSRGDSFQTLYSKGDKTYRATFTTQDDGVTDAAFSTSDYLEGTSFRCFYPASPAKWGKASDGEFVYGINVPTTQTAVAGGIVEGLNAAFAYTDQLSADMAEPLRFYNVLSLLKFRLSGEVVSRVKQVKLSSSGILAGDQVFHLVNGIPVAKPGFNFNGDVHSSTITLTGDFVAGEDYYIVLFPQEMPWFRMEFSDGADGFTRKQSAKSVTFERSRIKDLGTIDLGDDFTGASSSDDKVIKYMTATEGTKPVTIAVIPEGFRAEELSTYDLLAKSGINALFETEPYKTYRNRFNVYILRVASEESGASVTDGNGNITTAVNSYFGAYWGADSYADMRADDDKVFNYVTLNCPDIVDGIHTIDEVPIVMIVNDSRYGGRCWSWTSGRSYAIVPYIDHGAGLQWNYPNLVPSTDDPLQPPIDNAVLNANFHWTTAAEYAEVGQNYGDWRNTLVHEFGGHGFGRLGDEYWPDNTLNYTPNPIDRHSWQPLPFALNLAADPAQAPWKELLLDRKAELTARDARYGRIGAFQGGDNYLFGRWRSEKISCMIDNRFYFSAWQRYLITERIFTLSGDAAAFSFESWLAKDVTVDPVRDVASSGAPGAREHRTYRLVGPLPPPGLVED